MSPLPRNELLLRPGRHECKAQQRGAWRHELQAEATAPGHGRAALDDALRALAEVTGGRLPRRARLLVPDERAYLAMLPASPAWNSADAIATAHFAAALGRSDLLVRVVALPGGHGWLAAAIEPADMAEWQAALGEHGVKLVAVELALLHDLRAIARHVGDDAVVALLRDEGVTLIRIRAGVPVELTWERCDMESLDGIEQRLLAFTQVGDDVQPAPLVLLCRSHAKQETWRRIAKVHRWTLLTPRAPAPASTGMSTAAAEEAAA